MQGKFDNESTTTGGGCSWASPTITPRGSNTVGSSFYGGNNNFPIGAAPEPSEVPFYNMMPSVRGYANSGVVRNPFRSQSEPPSHRRVIRQFKEPIGRPHEIVEQVLQRKPVRIEENIKKVYEEPTIRKRREFIRSVTEEEERVPEVTIVEKVIEIEGQPDKVKEFKEIPVVVKEPVYCQPSPIVHETKKVVERPIPEFIEHVIEKVIETPRKKTVVKPRIVEREVPECNGLNLISDKAQLIIRDEFFQPEIRYEGAVQVKLARIVPQYIPVQVQIPCSKETKDKLKSEISKHIKYKVVYEDIIPASFNEAETIRKGGALNSYLVDRNEPIEADYDKISRGQGLPNLKEKLFRPADYNSWLLALNQHLEKPEDYGLSQDNFLYSHLPFVRTYDKNGNMKPIEFLPKGSDLIGTVIMKD